jgi:hypothetical protein
MLANRTSERARTDQRQILDRTQVNYDHPQIELTHEQK